MYGIDALQSLELALVGAGTLLARSPHFRAGQIEMLGLSVKNAAALFLPLPMHSLQLNLENLRAYLEQPGKPIWKNDEWRRSLVSAMREIGADLATLAAHLPVPAKVRNPK